LDDLGTGFKIAEGHRIGHGLMAKPVINIRRGSLF
jgi:hypothetical protein